MIGVFVGGGDVGGTFVGGTGDGGTAVGARASAVQVMVVLPWKAQMLLERSLRVPALQGRVSRALAWLPAPSLLKSAAQPESRQL